MAVTLNGMLDRLESARVRQRAFVADAAHELRSPLANMRTQLEVAQQLGGRTDWPAVADDLLADTKRLSRLVDDLLLLARADDGIRPTAPGDRPGRAGGAAHRRRASGTRPHRSGWCRPMVRRGPTGEPDALSRVLANLLDNAVRHATQRGGADRGGGGAGGSGSTW